MSCATWAGTGQHAVGSRRLGLGLGLGLSGSRARVWDWVWVRHWPAHCRLSAACRGRVGKAGGLQWVYQCGQKAGGAGVGGCKGLSEPYRETSRSRKRHGWFTSGLLKIPLKYAVWVVIARFVRCPDLSSLLLSSLELNDAKVYEH